MKKYEPLPMRPMRFRGVFGVAWNLYKRGFWGMFLYTFLFYGVISALIFFLRMANSATDPEWFASLFENGMEGFFDWLSDGGTLYTVSGGVALLVSLLQIANFMVVTPILEGGLYTEMRYHMFGNASGFGGMLRNIGRALRRFFKTQMILLLAWIIIGIAFFFITFISLLAIVIGAGIPMLISGGITPAGVIPMLVLLLVILLAFAVVNMLLMFVYPVAANESNRHVVRRSAKLVWKRFGRVLGVSIVACIVLGLICTVIIALTLFVLYLCFRGSYLFVENSIIAVAAELFLFVCLLYPYGIALTSALYFDAAARYPAPLEQPPVQNGYAPVNPNPEAAPVAQPVQEPSPIPAEPFEPSAPSESAEGQGSDVPPTEEQS